MRVIAGTARGRRLTTVGSNAVRPTSDRVKEAVFSMIGSRLDLHGSQALDLYAGSGALGIEALSRGAAHCVFVERERRAVAALRANLEICRLACNASVMVRPVASVVAGLAGQTGQAGDGRAFDVIFADPPYATDPAQLLELVQQHGLLVAGGLLAVEHASERKLAELGDLRLTRTGRYGKTAVTLLTRTLDPETEAP